jgi:hypothetical protein
MDSAQDARLLLLYYSIIGSSKYIVTVKVAMTEKACWNLTELCFVEENPVINCITILGSCIICCVVFVLYVMCPVYLYLLFL